MCHAENEAVSSETNQIFSKKYKLNNQTKDWVQTREALETSERTDGNYSGGGTVWRNQRREARGRSA